MIFTSFHNTLRGRLFSNLLPLIFVLLLINFAPHQLSENATALFPPDVGFLLATGTYLLVLCFIFLQNILLKPLLHHYKREILWLVHGELITFLFCYYFVFWAQRFLSQLPYFGDSAVVIVSLGMYFGGLIVFHATSGKKVHFANASSELRMLAPFAIPFALLVLFSDALELVPNETFQKFLGGSSLVSSLVLFTMSLGFLIILMIFLPYCLQKIWRCRPLHDPQLEIRLSEICQKANFRHAGFKIWTVVNDSLTAAIVGIIPRFRYILFTKQLLKDLPATSIEAILGHEIGHSAHKHLLIYPLIFLGMGAAVGLYSLFFSAPLISFLTLEASLHPHWPWETVLFPLAIFLPYAAIAGLYFRYIFGLFSRLFERQADLYVFTLGIPPQHLIDALDYIGVATGHTHHLANWHHYGIQQRIDFLRKASENPQLVSAHDRRVRRILVCYFVVLAVALGVLFAPMFSLQFAVS